MSLTAIPQPRTEVVPRRLADFDPSGYDKGRNLLWQALWFATMNVAWAKWWFPPRLRPAVLRLFGARVGVGTVIRHRVRILWPWKLEIGDHAWIGEDAWLLNLEPITVGSNACLSQGAFLCTGNHDRHDPRFGYRNRPIVVGDGAWVAAQASLAPGSVVPAGGFVAGRLERVRP